MTENDTLARTLVIILALIILIPFVLMLLAWPMVGMWGGGHMWDWNGAAGVGWAMGVMWLVPLAVILAIGFLLYRAIAQPDNSPRDPALEELRMAYARGDLTDEEFEERKDRLRSQE